MEGGGDEGEVRRRLIFVVTAGGGEGGAQVRGERRVGPFSPV